jgi:outer membrane immunogenic protein
VKKLLLTAMALSTLNFASAGAADLSRPPLHRAAPVARPFSWSGCYIGAHAGAGYTWTESVNAVNTTAFGDFAPGQGFANHSAGFAGGGHLGCNYQISYRTVIGIEGTYSGADITRDYFSPFGGGDDVYTNRIRAIATVTGRIAWAFDAFLFYTKLGWAGARAQLSVVDVVPSAGSGSASNWHNGIAFGSGMEYALTRNWIVGLESNYYRLEGKTYEIGGGAGLYTFNSRPRDVFSYLARISWKFD